jgi:hypothetical protein
MHGIGIGGGMHRNSRDAEFLASAQNPQGNLAAIGYENFIEHIVLAKGASSEWRVANGK